MKTKPIIGWREWVSLPGLSVDKIRAKVDSGAATSALYATHIREFERSGKTWVRFRLYVGLQGNRNHVMAEAPVVGRRKVRSSSGVAEERYVVREKICLADRCFTVQFTLTNRRMMQFAMLLGRQAMRRRFLVDPSLSWVHNPVKNIEQGK